MTLGLCSFGFRRKGVLTVMDGNFADLAESQIGTNWGVVILVKSENNSGLSDQSDLTLLVVNYKLDNVEAN